MSENHKYIIEYERKEGSKRESVINQEMTIRKIDANDPLFNNNDPIKNPNVDNRGSYDGKVIKFYDGNEKGLTEARKEIERDLQSKKDFVLNTESSPMARVGRSIGIAFMKGLRVFGKEEDGNSKLLTKQISNAYGEQSDYHEASVMNPSQMARDTKVLDSTMPSHAKNRNLDVNSENKRKHLSMGSSISLSDKNMEKDYSKNKDMGLSPN